MNSLLGFGWFLCGEMVLISSFGGCLGGFVSMYFDVFSGLCSVIDLGFRRRVLRVWVLFLE